MQDDKQTNKQYVSEDRVTQPMEAGGRVSQKCVNTEHLSLQN